jgi:hypothetical protein
MKNAADKQMPQSPNIFNQPKKNLRKAKSSDAQITFDTEMEAIRNFHIHTSLREATLDNLGELSPKPEDTTILHHHLKDTQQNVTKIRIKNSIV